MYVYMFVYVGVSSLWMCKRDYVCVCVCVCVWLCVVLCLTILCVIVCDSSPATIAHKLAYGYLYGACFARYSIFCACAPRKYTATNNKY